MYVYLYYVRNRNASRTVQAFEVSVPFEKYIFRREFVRLQSQHLNFVSPPHCINNTFEGAKVEKLFTLCSQHLQVSGPSCNLHLTKTSGRNVYSA